MKILYCHTSIPSEGSQVHANSFLNAYRAAGGSIRNVWIPYKTLRGPKTHWSLARRLFAKSLWLLSNLRGAVRVLFMAIRERPDVILFRLDPMHRLAGGILASSFFFPVVLEVNAVRSIEGATGRPGISDVLDGLMFSRARISFAVSQMLKKHILEHYKLDESQVTVIENGVDEGLFSPDIRPNGIRRELGLRGAFIVGFVGSFRPWHGVHLILDIAKAIEAQSSDIHFVLVGDGPERPALEARVRRDGLDSYVHLVGFRPHATIPGILADMNVLVAPFPTAAYERGFYGSALKVFEYMAMAKPVVTPPLGQLAEVIDHGVSGYLVPSEDVEGVVKVLLDLKSKPELCARVGQRARERIIESYTWQENARRVRALCEGVMNGV